MTASVYPALAAALAATDPSAKVAQVEQLAAAWKAGHLVLDDTPVELVCGRPQRPQLVHPGQVRQRGPATLAGRASLLHAIVHIEFSAINLALDHAARFRGLGRDYVDDWIGVAAEEAHHFRLLDERLGALGYAYGDFPAHGGLWEMAERTRHDPLLRMALVPRLLEARGLDATPPIQAKLEQAGDRETSRLLDLILHDEIGHVALGDRWFRTFCGQRGLAPEATYLALLTQFKAPRPPAPMNEAARLAAGFSPDELRALAH